MWALLAGSLMAPPPRQASGAGKLLVAAAAAGAIASLAWHAHSTRHVRTLGVVTPPAPTVTVPAPASPAAKPTLGELGSPTGREREVRRPRVRPVDSLAQEQRLIDEAREALAHGLPRDAATALDEHARRFAHGQLDEERESLAIRIELTLGRLAQARTRAAAFLAHRPDSLFAPVVRSLAARAAVSAPVEP
jgi:hypothetical protein